MQLVEETGPASSAMLRELALAHFEQKRATVLAAAPLAPPPTQATSVAGSDEPELADVALVEEEVGFAVAEGDDCREHGEASPRAPQPGEGNVPQEPVLSQV